MSIKFLCCACGRKLRAAAAMAGRSAKCPRCAQTVAVPRAPAAAGAATGLVPPPAVNAVLVQAAAEAPPATGLVPAVLRLRGFRKDKTFWLRIGGGAATVLLLLAAVSLLIPGCMK